MIKTVMFDLDGTLLPFDKNEFINYYFGGLCKNSRRMATIPTVLSRMSGRVRAR